MTTGGNFNDNLRLTNQLKKKNEVGVSDWLNLNVGQRPYQAGVDPLDGSYQVSEWYRYPHE